MSRHNVNPVTTSPLSRQRQSSLRSPPPGPLVLTATSLCQPKVAIFVKNNGHVTLIHADVPEKQQLNQRKKGEEGEGEGEEQVETSLVHAMKPLYIRRQDYSRSEASFIGLPVELSVQILLYCRPRDVCTVAQTSHGMKLVASNEAIWQQVCVRRRWTPTIPDLYLSAPSAWYRYTLRRHACARRARSIWPLLATYLGPSAMLMASHVSDEQIKQAQITCQWKQFSEELLASIRMVDGQDETLPVGRGAVYGCRILSLREIVHEKRVFFPDQEWLPVTSLSGHQRVCLNDLGLVYLLSGLVPHYVAADWLTFLELVRHRA